MTTVELSPLVESVEFNWVRLGDVASIDRKAIAPESIVDGTTYVGLENIVSGGEFLRVGPVKNGELASQKFVFGTDHILYGKLRPYLAKIAMPDFAGICSTDILPVRVGDSLDKRFLAYFLRQDWVVDQVNGLASGANLPRISPKSLESVEVPVFPMPYQRRIAAILDKADHLRTQRREALACLDALTQSMFISMFGTPGANQILHPIVQISEVLESATYGTSEKASLKGDTPVLRMNNITYSGELDLTNLKYMPAGQPEKHLVRDGDLLFNRTNSKELVGKTCVYRGSEGMAYAGYLVRLRLSDQMTPEYLNTFMNLGQTKQLLRNMCKSIVGMANINAKEVQKIRLPLPPLELQQTFARRVTGVERLKEQHRTQLAELDTLFASLQHRAFRGEL